MSPHEHIMLALLQGAIHEHLGYSSLCQRLSDLSNGAARRALGLQEPAPPPREELTPAQWLEAALKVVPMDEDEKTALLTAYEEFCL